MNYLYMNSEATYEIAAVHAIFIAESEGASEGASNVATGM